MHYIRELIYNIIIIIERLRWFRVCPEKKKERKKNDILQFLVHLVHDHLLDYSKCA